MSTELKYLLVLFWVACFCSCSEKQSSNVENVSYSVMASVDNWEDSIFLSKVKSLQIKNNELCFCDQYLSKLFVLDKKLNLKQMIGKKGEGPDEFIHIGTMFVLDSIFYVYDVGRASVVCCNRKGEFLEQYKLADYLIPPYFRFIVNDSSFIISSEKEKQAFLEYNMQTKIASFWGEKTSFANEKQYQIRNGRYILNYEDKYLSISNNLPFVEVYDRQSKQLLNKLDYSDVEIIQDVLFENKTNINSSSYNWLVFDACVEDDCLYLLLNGRNDREGFNVNRILMLNLLSSELKKCILKLPGKVYDTFCIENDTIYAFNHSDSRIEMLTKEK